MNHDEYRQSVEAYALGALDRNETQPFEDHLASCDVCRAAVASYDVVVARLGREAVSAPLKAPAVSRRHTFQRWYAPYAAAAAVMVLSAGASVYGFVQARATQQNYAAIAMMLATDSRQVAMAGVPGVSGTAIVGARESRTGFVVSGLSPAQSGEVYRVWVQRPNGRSSLGVLQSTKDGLYILVTSGDELRGATEVGVSAEMPRPILRRQIVLRGVVERSGRPIRNV